MKKQSSARWMGLIAVALLIFVLVVSVPVDEPVEETHTITAGEQMDLLAGVADSSEVDAGTVEWSVNYPGVTGATTISDVAWKKTQVSGAFVGCDSSCCPAVDCFVDNAGRFNSPINPNWNGKITMELAASQWGATSSIPIYITIAETDVPTITWNPAPTASTLVPPATIDFGFDADEPVASCEYQVKKDDVVVKDWSYTDLDYIITTSTSLSAGPPRTYTQDFSGSFTADHAGSYVVQARCTDAAGNVGTSTISSAIVLTLPVEEDCNVCCKRMGTGTPTCSSCRYAKVKQEWSPTEYKCVMTPKTGTTSSIWISGCPATGTCSPTWFTDAACTLRPPQYNSVYRSPTDACSW